MRYLPLTDIDRQDMMKAIGINEVEKLFSDVPQIAEESEKHENWQPPIVQRDDLTPKTIRRIATFVSRSLLDTLIKRNNVNEKLVEDVRKTVRKRIERGDIEENSQNLPTGEAWAKQLFDAGKLDKNSIRNAIKERELAFIHHALALMSKLPHDAVQKMMATPSGKGVTALSYKAGLA